MGTTDLEPHVLPSQPSVERHAKGPEKSLSYWSTANGDDTMVTLWNPADEAQNLIFTLFFAGGSYRYPVPLGPRATRTLNVSEIIQNQLPDENGNTIPTTVHEGSAEIAGAQAEHEHILIGIAAGTYNVRKATCAGNCITCSGYVGDEFDLIDAGIPVGSTTTATYSLLNNTGTYVNVSSSSSWSSSSTSIATVNNPGKVAGIAPGTFTGYATSATEPEYDKYDCPTGDTGACPQEVFHGSGGGLVAQLKCTTPVTRGGTTKCTAVGSSGSTFSKWTFTDGSGNPVTGTGTTSTWSGMMVTSGTVSVSVTSGGATSTPTAQITVNNRTNFAFSAVSPTQVASNSITCYNGTVHTLPSPPVDTASDMGGSCPDLAFSFQTAAPISDNGPNNGYQYVTSVSSTSGSQPTKFEYIVVSDLLSATTFYKAQCGNYSSSNSTGYIAGSQLNQNVFDHESGSVMSHWTEYSVAQNNSSNNIGTVLESEVGPPNTSQQTFTDKATGDGNDASARIQAPVAVEPCNEEVNEDSSQSCKYCGSINFSPYQSCGNSQPVPYCH